MTLYISNPTNERIMSNYTDRYMQLTSYSNTSNDLISALKKIVIQLDTKVGFQSAF